MKFELKNSLFMDVETASALPGSCSCKMRNVYNTRC